MMQFRRVVGPIAGERWRIYTPGRPGTQSELFAFLLRQKSSRAASVVRFFAAMNLVERGEDPFDVADNGSLGDVQHWTCGSLRFGWFLDLPTRVIVISGWSKSRQKESTARKNELDNFRAEYFKAKRRGGLVFHD